MNKFAASLIWVGLVAGAAFASQPPMMPVGVDQSAIYNLPIMLMNFGEDHIAVNLNGSTLWEGDVTGKSESEQQWGLSKRLSAHLTHCNSLSITGRHVSVARNICVTSKTKVILVEGDWRFSGRRNPYIEIRNQPVQLD